MRGESMTKRRLNDTVEGNQAGLSRRCLTISALALLIVSQASVLGYQVADSDSLSEVENVVVYMAQVESQAAHLTGRQDVCIAVRDDEGINEQHLLSALRKKKMVVHSAAWCNRGPRGMRLGIV